MVITIAPGDMTHDVTKFQDIGYRPLGALYDCYILVSRVFLGDVI
jgi:hypothetical protein